MATIVLSEDHSRREDFTERITSKQWKEILLDYRDHVIFQGRCRQLGVKNLGVGVVEVFKLPLPEGED